MRHQIDKVLLSLLLLAWLSGSNAAVFKWRDQDGKTNYSEKAPAGQRTETVTVPPISASRTPVSQVPRRQQRPTPTPKAAPTMPPAERQVLCEQARTHFAELERTPRIFSVDTSGERVRLTEEERQAAMAHEQEAITKYCE
jgi:hypothetical protein